MWRYSTAVFSKLFRGINDQGRVVEHGGGRGENAVHSGPMPQSTYLSPVGARRAKGYKQSQHSR